jgi:hypothetical protein
MKKEIRNKKVSIIGIKIYCPTLAKNVIVKKESLYWSGGESECEMCGSHGSVDVVINKCVCGKKHEICLRDW